MLRCPTCGRTYEPGPRFCPDDGTPLVDVSAPDAAPRPTPPSERYYTGVTSSRASQELDDLLKQPDAGSARHGRYAQPVGASEPANPYGENLTDEAPESVSGGEAEWADEVPRRSSALTIGLVAVVLIAAAATAAFFFLRPDGKLEQEAYDAIARGDLVTPARVSAVDFAQRLGPEAAARVGVRALPALVAAADEFYARFYTTSDATKADWERTDRLLGWATEIAPDDAHVRARAAYARARLAALDGDASAAREGYEAAAEAWPEWALPPNSLGVALADAGNSDAAIAQYRKAARLDPAWPFPASNLGALYVRLKRYDAAVVALEGAVRLDPRRPGPHAMLARALAETGAIDGAVNEANEALRLAPAATVASDGFDARRLRADVETWRARPMDDDEDLPFDDEPMGEYESDTLSM